jgi:hypothetical protein
MTNCRYLSGSDVFERSVDGDEVGQVASALVPHLAVETDV